MLLESLIAKRDKLDAMIALVESVEAFNRHRQSYVFSGDYPTLQEAVNAAKDLKKPLRIEAKTHVLTETLVVDGLNRMSITADKGALFTTANEMDTLIEFVNCRQSEIIGGTYKPDHKVDKCFYLRSTDGSSFTDVTFDGIDIQGKYVHGVYIGEPDVPQVVDHVDFVRFEARGMHDDDPALGLNGVVIGSIDSNIQNITLQGRHMAGHDVHIRQGAVDYVSVRDFGFNRSTTADIIMGFSMVIDSVRSEKAKGKFIGSAGNASSFRQVSVSNIKWTPLPGATNDIAIDYQFAGNLTLNNFWVKASQPYRIVAGNWKDTSHLKIYNLGVEGATIDPHPHATVFDPLPVAV